MEPLEIALFALWSFAVAVAGGVAGLVLGNLRLPATVLLASSPAAAAGANVAISGVAALAAALAHLRAGRLDARLFWLMGPPSIAGGVAGGLLAGALPDRALLAAIAAVVLYGAFEVARHRRPEGDRGDPEGPHPAAAVVTGAGIGVLGGLVGLILGSLRLPAMI